MFFNATPIYESGVDAILLGLSGYPVDDFDRHITTDVRHHLFEKPNEPLSGMDLPAINIQRSRDHGLQPYVHYRQWCGFSKPRTFEDLADTTAPEAIEALKQAYRSVDDIDLFPGLMTERSVRGGLLGPTMACIVADQFIRARKCDRFWYENDLPGVRFTPGKIPKMNFISA